MNALYHAVEKDEGLKKKIKMIGIGVGNNPSEVEVFRRTHKILFPLFSDYDFVAYMALGKVKTPYFIGVKINADGTHEVVYSKQGSFGKVDKFLRLIRKSSGLK